MQCPHCHYEHGYSEVYHKKIDGYIGDFYKLHDYEMKKLDDSEMARTLYACPSCRKTFIDYDWCA